MKTSIKLAAIPFSLIAALLAGRSEAPDSATPSPREETSTTELTLFDR